MLTKEWIAEIKNLGLDHKGEILLALKTLESWKAFAREYANMGITEIRRLIEEDIEDNERR